MSKASVGLNKLKHIHSTECDELREVWGCCVGTGWEEKSRTWSHFYNNSNCECVWLCTVKDAKLLRVVTPASRRRRYFQLLLFTFLFCFFLFFFFFTTSMCCIYKFKQKHRRLPWFLPTPLKPEDHGPRSPLHVSVAPPAISLAFNKCSSRRVP